MSSIDIFIRYSSLNVHLNKITTLSKVDNLIYNDEGGEGKGHIKTALKFTMLTIASPFFALARLVRSVAFICLGDAKSAGREFIGALAMPLMTASCLLGTLLASVLYPFASDQISSYITMRRTYAFFEAWVNGISLSSSNLTSYSQRVSGSLEPFAGRIWTTAPCMQPLLENGLSSRGGLLDKERIQRMLPLIKVKDVLIENGKVVIQSEYTNEQIRLSACNGICVHQKVTADCCCCWRVDAVYNRICCCEVGQGKCVSKSDSRNSCGIATCSCCGLSACCCYLSVKGDENTVNTVNVGCFGSEDSFCIRGFVKTSA